MDAGHPLRCLPRNRWVLLQALIAKRTLKPWQPKRSPKGQTERLRKQKECHG